MTELGTLTLTGQSGTEYTFDVYPADTDWNPGVACVYYISNRTPKSDGGWTHSAIYIGETNDLRDRLANHHKQACFDRHDYNAISIYQLSDSDDRLIAEDDLITAIDPPCNG